MMKTRRAVITHGYILAVQDIWGDPHAKKKNKSLAAYTSDAHTNKQIRGQMPHVQPK